jgi:uncharacterized cupin superfamily protein
MDEPIIALPLAGRVLGTADNDFVVAEWRDPGGPAGPPRFIAPRHLHRNDDEAWYVLEGVLRVQVGDKITEACAGSAVLVPRGTVHTYWNPGTGVARYLLVMTSRIFRLIQGIHSLPDRNHAALKDLFAKYDSELVD